MSLSFMQSQLRKVMAVALVCVFPASMWAQDAQTAQSAQTAPPQASTSQTALPAAPTSHTRSEMVNYSKPRGYFPNPLGPYTARAISPPDLTNSPMLEKLMRDGKIYISMDDA